jgi:protein-S-isoprenylcysteine O-methyltransferase Ste14
MSALQSAALPLGRFVFRYRDYLAVVAVLATIVLMPPVAFLHRDRSDLALDGVGLAVALTGQALRAVVIGLAYIKRGGRNKEITADRLVCEGVFAHSRNPLYLGNFLIVTGLLIMWNSPLAYLVVLTILGASLLSIVRAEEQFLVGRFGEEYVGYCKRVPRFIPRLAGFGDTLAQFDFDWRRLIRKEYGTTFAWITVALIVFVVEKAWWHGVDASTGRIRIGIAVWLLAFALYLTARWLKKTHRIDSSG